MRTVDDAGTKLSTGERDRERQRQRDREGGREMGREGERESARERRAFIKQAEHLAPAAVR
jgi:hypothetical protein